MEYSTREKTVKLEFIPKRPNYFLIPIIGRVKCESRFTIVINGIDTGKQEVDVKIGDTIELNTN